MPHQQRLDRSLPGVEVTVRLVPPGGAPAPLPVCGLVRWAAWGHAAPAGAATAVLVRAGATAATCPGAHLDPGVASVATAPAGGTVHPVPAAVTEVTDQKEAEAMVVSTHLHELSHTLVR